MRVTTCPRFNHAEEHQTEHFHHQILSVSSPYTSTRNDVCQAPCRINLATGTAELILDKGAIETDTVSSLHIEDIAQLVLEAQHRAECLHSPDLGSREGDLSLDFGVGLKGGKVRRVTYGFLDKVGVVALRTKTSVLRIAVVAKDGELVLVGSCADDLVG